MSRIGKQPINLPSEVKVEIGNRQVTVIGPKGRLTQTIPAGLEAATAKGEDGIQQLIVKPVRKTKHTAALWGLTRSLLFNMVKGVIEGFEKKLIIEGVGYRAAVQGNKLVLSLGLSHPVEIEAPEGITFTTAKNEITIVGIDKQLVGEIAAKIRAQKKPEPYKGKGIRYVDEVIRRKAGKKAAGAE